MSVPVGLKMDDGSVVNPWGDVGKIKPPADGPKTVEAVEAPPAPAADTADVPPQPNVNLVVDFVGDDGETMNFKGAKVEIRSTSNSTGLPLGQTGGAYVDEYSVTLKDGRTIALTAEWPDGGVPGDSRITSMFCEGKLVKLNAEEREALAQAIEKAAGKYPMEDDKARLFGLAAHLRSAQDPT